MLLFAFRTLLGLLVIVCPSTLCSFTYSRKVIHKPLSFSILIPKDWGVVQNDTMCSFYGAYAIRDSAFASPVVAIVSLEKIPKDLFMNRSNMQSWNNLDWKQAIYKHLFKDQLQRTKVSKTALVKLNSTPALFIRSEKLLSHVLGLQHSYVFRHKSEMYLLSGQLYLSKRHHKNLTDLESFLNKILSSFETLQIASN